MDFTGNRDDAGTRLATLPDMAQQLDPVHSWHEEIRQKEGHLFLRENAQGFLAVGRLGDLVAKKTQQLPHGNTKDRLVVDYQDRFSQMPPGDPLKSGRDGREV